MNNIFPRTLLAALAAVCVHAGAALADTPKIELPAPTLTPSFPQLPPPPVVQPEPEPIAAPAPAN